MKRSIIVVFLALFFVGGCRYLFEGSSSGIEKIYEQNKNSVFVVKSCPATFSYPEFEVRGYQPYVWGKNWIEVSVTPTNYPQFTYEDHFIEYSNRGTGFLADDYLITNSHVVKCAEDKIEDSIKSYTI